MRSRIKAAIAEGRTTARSLAADLGVHEVTVQRWCTDDGIGGMRRKDAERVAAALGCRVADLFKEGPAGS